MRRAQIMDEVAVHRTLTRITHEIIERNHGVEEVCLLGIKGRGVPIAEKIADNIEKFEGEKVAVGYLDITKHRDDMTKDEKAAKATECYIPIDLTDKTVVLVDDVMYTGRTARAAIEAVFSFGRPKEVQLAVLIDRGHRELPIRPDFVGKNVPTAKHEKIAVNLGVTGEENGVFIIDNS